MADIEYILPGSGIVNDTEEGFEMVTPVAGIYNQQEAAAPAGDIPLFIHHYTKNIGA
jgi:hypothetical protein